jgi:hypothetical protein
MLNALIEELLPLTTMLTPNNAETVALLLVQHQHSLRLHSGCVPVPVPATITLVKDMLRASRELCTLSPRTALLKGGHMAHGAGMSIGDVQAATAAATIGNRRVHRITLECDGSIGFKLNMKMLFRTQAAALAHDPAIRDVPVVVDILYAVSNDGDDNNMGYQGIGGSG